MKIGFFGKLPSFGDFIYRGVSADLSKSIDSWIMQSIEESKGCLKDSWQNMYFNSPIWRFTTSPGILSENTVTGLVMPSVDKSGRCYPFTIIIEADKNVNPFTLTRQVDYLHEKAEDFILNLLNLSNIKPEDILQELILLYKNIEEYDHIDVTPLEMTNSQQLFATLDKSSSDFSTKNEAFLFEAINKLNNNVSIWWTVGGNGFSPRTLYFHNMPPPDYYSSLLTGEEHQ